MKMIILLNPAAGRGKARRALRDALEVLRDGGVEPQVRVSRDAQHLLELTREARKDRPDLVVSVGGDGTHHYVLNGLYGREAPLGLISGGRGNDFAKGMGIPVEPHAAAEVLLKARIRQIDLARAGSRVYAGIAGVGFDSVVNRFANERVRGVGGSIAYAWAILRCLNSYSPQPLELRSDAQDFSGDVMFAVVGNNVSYGGGAKMTPRAKLDDGLLDVCIVPALGKLEFLRWIPRAYRGTHLAHPRIVYFRARKVALTSPARLELFGDGEYLQELPATIEIAPRALRMIVPA